ncbi:unnamed protein product [Closterium sp. NIES-53]
MGVCWNICIYMLLPGATGAASSGGAGATGAGGAGAAGTAPRRLFFYPQPQSSLLPPDSVLCQVLSLLSSTGLTPPLLCPPTDQSQPQLLPGSLLPTPAPHTEVTDSLTERREPEPPASSLPHVLDPESDLARGASPTVTRLLATVVTDPDFESTAVFSLVTELVDFVARSCLDYVASLVTESEFVCRPSVGGERALSSDVLQDRKFELECLAATLPRFASMLLCPEGDPDALDIPTLRSYAEAIVGEYSSQWQTAMDAEMASWKSTNTNVDEVPPPGANIVDGMWISDLHEEIWLRRPPGFTGSFHAGTQRSLRRPVYGLRQAPREWHDTLITTLAALGFSPSTTDPFLFLCTDTTLPPFYVLMYVDDLVFATADMEALALFSSPQATPLSTGHSLSAPPSDESVEPSGPYPELVDFLMYLMSTLGMGLVLGGWGSVVLLGHSDASWPDDHTTQRSSQGYTFSLGPGFVSWRSTRSSSVLGSSYDAEIYAGAMAAQELRWLTYLLTDLGERPRSPPWLPCERGQLRLSYVASRVNIADVFTKALGSGDHQRLCTALGLVPTPSHVLVA